MVEVDVVAVAGHQQLTDAVVFEDGALDVGDVEVLGIAEAGADQSAGVGKPGEAAVDAAKTRAGRSRFAQIPASKAARVAG